jgi:hypothetical protein
MYRIYMPVDMVLVLSSKNSYWRRFKQQSQYQPQCQEQHQHQHQQQPRQQPSDLKVENSNSTCIELFKFW